MSRIALAAILTVFTVAFFFFALKTSAPLEAGLPKIIKLELASTVDAANEFLGKWRAAKGQSWREPLRESLRWDTWFIVSYAPLLGLLCWVAAEAMRAEVRGVARLGWALAILQIVAGTLDFAENAAMRKMIGAGTADAATVRWCFMVSASKWLLILAGAGFIIYVLYYFAVGSASRR